MYAFLICISDANLKGISTVGVVVHEHGQRVPEFIKIMRRQVQTQVLWGILMARGRSLKASGGIVEHHVWTIPIVVTRVEEIDARTPTLRIVKLVVP